MFRLQFRMQSHVHFVSLMWYHKQGLTGNSKLHVHLT